MDFQFSVQIFIAFLAGAISAVILVWVLARLWLSQVRDRARHIIELAEHDAEASVKEIQANARFAFEKLRAEQENQIARQRIELDTEKRSVDDLQQTLRTREEETRELESAYRQRVRRVTFKEEHVDNLRRRYRQQLRAVTQINESEVEERLRDEVRQDCQDELSQLRREILSRGEQQLRDDASRALVDVMQRLSTSTSSAVAASTVDLPNEEMKGRIIGREGRNIKAFETETGVTLMIDETPDQVVISSFDPVRREVARIALEALVADGRIHPAAIENAVADAEREVQDSVIALGENALHQLKMTSVHPEIVALLGKLRYRLSNNQNTLEHSIEVAFMSSLLASELGLDPELAKRAGLFHDIGKAMSHEYEASHALAAGRLLRRYGEDPRIVNAVEAHHEEVAAESVYAGLLIVADGLSATRPGARSETMEGYIQRVRALEDIAKSFDGVNEAYALQAGREIRVIVEPEKVDDKAAQQMSRKLRHRIEDEMQYPGQIKITVVRERRFTDVAK